MISGGYAAFGIGLSAFIADISSPDQRAFRMGMIHLAQSLGRPIAAPLGAYLLETGEEIPGQTLNFRGDLKNRLVWY